MAMLQPTIPGWKAETIGDDIAWMRFGDDGQLYAINPEAGFFGVAPGTGHSTNRHAVDALHGNAVFTNVALTEDNDVWWEGLTTYPPDVLTDWKGQTWHAGSHKEPAAHPNARFTVPASQCPIIAPEWQDPKGVPISAILFGGRRASAVPLVTEAFNWQHGVFLASNVASEGTAAAENKVGELRRDPFAMLPFCGYNMGDYFAHWLRMGQTKGAKLPKIFFVNWFRKDKAGQYVWPGYGDNSRVLKWIAERLDGKAQAQETPIGLLPTKDSLDVSGLDLSDDQVELLLSVDRDVWAEEASLIPPAYEKFGERLPEALWDEYDALISRLYPPSASHDAERAKLAAARALRPAAKSGIPPLKAESRQAAG
jgi:phosphoenolpyruvate carboxykinase (GTP)